MVAEAAARFRRNSDRIPAPSGTTTESNVEMEKSPWPSTGKWSHAERIAAHEKAISALNPKAVLSTTETSRFGNYLVGPFPKMKPPLRIEVMSRSTPG